ncbi:MAG: glycosyltransferase [Saprospiraceae bacterium]|nr:glycosyltransferase [Pyrinomonadaceae bacterium]
MAGDVEHKITLHLINDCDILLRTTKFDGDAISIREALYLKTPIIATDNGMRPEGLNLIPAPATIKALGGKILHVFERKALEGSAIPSTGRENIEAVLDVYDELMQA